MLAPRFLEHVPRQPALAIHDQRALGFPPPCREADYASLDRGEAVLGSGQSRSCRLTPKVPGSPRRLAGVRGARDRSQTRAHPRIDTAMVELRPIVSRVSPPTTQAG